jgi:hypothetical protein
MTSHKGRKLWLGIALGLLAVYVISRIIADPETALLVAGIFAAPTLVIGGLGHIALSVAHAETGDPAYRPSLRQSGETPGKPRRKVLYPPHHRDSV